MEGNELEGSRGFNRNERHLLLLGGLVARAKELAGLGAQPATGLLVEDTGGKARRSNTDGDERRKEEQEVTYGLAAPPVRGVRKAEVSSATSSLVSGSRTWGMSGGEEKAC